jgi:hypothetical protein
MFALLLSICRLVAAGRITERVAETLTTGRLMAMAKPERGVRPIAVGEVLLRLVGRAIGRQLREQFQQSLQPFQFGVATPGGCEAVVHGVRAHLDVHPDHVLLQTDVENAFNCIHRTAIFSELRERMPQLVPFFRATYGFEGRLVYVREAGPVIVPSATGVHQGDALSMPFFALGSAPVLREMASMVPEVLAAVADDCTLLGPPVPTRAAIDVYSSEMERIGCAVRMGKCAMWGPSGLPADLDLPEEMERPEEEVVVLEVPIGSEAFTIAAVRAKLEIHVQHLDTLPQLQDSQVALSPHAYEVLRPAALISGPYGGASSGRHWVVPRI